MCKNCIDNLSPREWGVGVFVGEGENMRTDYDDVVDMLGALYGDDVYGADFYTELFPDNECSGCSGGGSSSGVYVPNAIYLYRDGDERERRRIMLADTWEDDYLEYVERNPLALCSGLSYRGRANTLANAQRMYALIIDLDSVGRHELETLLRTRCDRPADQIRSVPQPTFIAASGAGLHLYYQLVQPIDLYPAIKAQIKKLKNDYTYTLWDPKCTTKCKTIQYQSINQAFRMIGSVNSKYGTVVRVWRTGEPVSIETLNNYCMDDENRVDLSERRAPGKTPLADAKKKWPAWYKTRIVDSVPNITGRWKIEEKTRGDDPYALYHWFLRFAPKIKGGHRYYFMMCCVIYASKCAVPYSQLVDDMKQVYERLRIIKNGADELKESDMRSALKAYKKNFYNIRISDIERMTGLQLPRNKRNGRPQKVHMATMRAIQGVIDPAGSWRNKDGRPTKQQQVQAWRAAHPDGKKIDCERETGLSRHTVLKWW